jgi:serine phosphatase RsbU (regulator of sigma subunit)/anti-sigma regulatory factor (Ser/Thr protein kinase)
VGTRQTAVVDRELEHRIELPGDPSSPAAARRILGSRLRAAGLGDVAYDALLLASELCENAVLHAGTGFELAYTIDGSTVTVAVTDHGSTAMELRRGLPSDRQDTHNRGLQLVDTLATAWGSRHDSWGHQVWFTLGGTPRVAPAAPQSPEPPVDWPDTTTSRWLLHLPARTAAVLPLPDLVTELVRRLCDVLRADGASVWVDFGEGERELASYGVPGGTITAPLPLSAPRKGQLRVRVGSRSPAVLEIVELTAQRVALAVESDGVHGADHDRWVWLSFLAEASELLGNSLDVQLTAAILPQIVVPWLGRWCAVHLLDSLGEPQLSALTHAEETMLPVLRENLHEQTREVLRKLLADGGDAVRLHAPVDGIAVPLRLGRTRLGTLSVGRRGDRAHGPAEFMMISELARRAAQAIDNAKRDTAHVATSQALQQALLPRALPTAPGVRFAAAYLPASLGADVGGDFYDVLTLDDGRWLAAIGDVCGKGPRAAARTALVRDVLRLLVRHGEPLTRAVRLLHETMLEADDPEQFATVAVALISPSPGGLDVELVLAGHEQPILLRGNGSVVRIGEHGTAVGLMRSFAVHPTSHVLNAGDTLVFYTDGVTERRRGGEQFGEERVAHTLAAASGGSADELVDVLRRTVHTFSPEPHQDDIAIMAVQVSHLVNRAPERLEVS